MSIPAVTANAPHVTPSSAAGPPQPALIATQTLEAIVFREILEPLAADLGPVGDVALGTVADTLFARPKP